MAFEREPVEETTIREILDRIARPDSSGAMNPLRLEIVQRKRVALGFAEEA